MDSTELELLVEIINRKLLEKQIRPLSYTEILIMQGIWHYQTYHQIAQEKGYSAGYFTNVVAPQLCQRLTELVGSRVTKKNCRVLLESYLDATCTALKTTMLKQHSVDSFPDTDQKPSPSYPSGPVPLGSSFYIENSTLSTRVYEEISKPGALVRIKAPKEMGKTSMLLRILNYAESQGYRTVSLNLEQIDSSILNELNLFLRWLCANVSRQLQIEPRLDDYWDEDIGSKVSCSLYFRKHLLEQINSPVVLVLDEVNQIFEHPQVAKDFLPMLRSWYEEAKRLLIWQKLRLIVIHSTEIYVPLELNQSPFNVGLPIQLGDFCLEQVQQLAQSYGLDWSNGEESQQLMTMVGGHPALIHMAIYYLSFEEMNLAELLKTAPTSSGIYSHHLQRHWVTLQQQLELLIAVNAVMSSTEPVQLEPIVAYKLSSMGLIKLDGNKATPFCQLYRQYFNNQQLKIDENNN
ncbi:AAA-like domain-containing protein [Nostoc sp. FACHB-888]|uniref:AAA-like domain-containing protein n=1 Tax=Nostoc sp. FACHB-888 TaxID=2692842 RepID=UPI00168A144A|nr:AAA-like domain-containing protein [Nostoc sp. FACHB-888]MBD2248116.1 AAA-like domain-containing protein [Nostoc sp. FACHB-888]